MTGDAPGVVDFDAVLAEARRNFRCAECGAGLERWLVVSAQFCSPKCRYRFRDRRRYAEDPERERAKSRRTTGRTGRGSWRRLRRGGGSSGRRWRGGSVRSVVLCLRVGNGSCVARPAAATRGSGGCIRRRMRSVSGGKWSVVVSGARKVGRDAERPFSARPMRSRLPRAPRLFRASPRQACCRGCAPTPLARLPRSQTRASTARCFRRRSESSSRRRNLAHPRRPAQPSPSVPSVHCQRRLS